MPKLVAHYAQRRPVLELGNIDVERDFADVRLLADAYVRLLGSDAAGEVVNICSGVGRSLRSILAELQAITGHAPEIRVAPQLVRRAEVRRLVGSNRRLAEFIGAPAFTDFGATLRWMVAECSGQPRAAS